jgi:hypothetical protein
MPWMTVPIAMVIAGGTTAATSIYANRQQRKSNERATDIEQKSIDEQIALQREQMEEERLRWEEEQDMLEAAHKAQQENILAERDELRYRWESDEAHAEPYREAGYGALSELVSRAGLPAIGPRTRPEMPASMRPDATDASTVIEVDTKAPGRVRPMSERVRAMDEPTLPVMLRDQTEPMTPQAYARIATTPEVVSAMSPDELQTFEEELASIPMSALLTRSRRTARRAV